MIINILKCFTFGEEIGLLRAWRAAPCKGARRESSMATTEETFRRRQIAVESLRQENFK